ncbi:MAG: insulinase family protein [Phycisphaerales bacterium]|nr:insulinase family protein [Phycisphaerales bacterium]
MPAAGATFSPAPRALNPLSERTRYDVLRNGVQVVVVEDRERPLIAVQLWIRTGFADDDELPGTCELVRATLDARRRRDAALGAAHLSLDSQTLADATAFFSLIPADEALLAATLRAHADLLMDRPLSAQELAAATPLTDGVPLYSKSRDVARLRAALFSGHPYSIRPPSAEDFTAAAELAEEFRATRFVSRSAVVVVGGDVTRAAAMAAVRDAFDGVPDRPRPTRADRDIPRHPMPQQPPPQVDGHAIVTLGWVTPFHSDFENVVLEVLMHRLCNPVDGPLHRALTEIGCPAPKWRLTRMRDAGILTVSIQSDGTRAEQRGGAIHDRVLATLRAAGAAPLDPIELLRARALASAQLRSVRTSFSATLQRLGEIEAVGGDMLLAELDFARVQRVLAADVREAALSLADRPPAMIVRPFEQPTAVQFDVDRFDAIPPLVAPAPVPHVRILRPTSDANYREFAGETCGLIANPRTDSGSAVLFALGARLPCQSAAAAQPYSSLHAQFSFRGATVVESVHPATLALVAPAEQAPAVVELLRRYGRDKSTESVGATTTDPLPAQVIGLVGSTDAPAAFELPMAWGVVGMQELAPFPRYDAQSGPPRDRQAPPEPSAAALLTGGSPLELHALLEAANDRVPPLWPFLIATLLDSRLQSRDHPADTDSPRWSARPFGNRGVLVTIRAPANEAAALLKSLEFARTELADVTAPTLDRAYRSAAIWSYHVYESDTALARHALECAILARPGAESRDSAQPAADPVAAADTVTAARQCLADGGAPRLRAVIQIGGNAEIISATGLIPAERVRTAGKPPAQPPEPELKSD